MSNPIKAVIFDKDGTLHDTEKVFVQAWHLAAAEFDVPDMESTIRDCTGMPLPGIERYWNAKYPSILFADYIPRRQYYFNEIIKDGIPLKEGCIEVLTYLREHGYRVGMATSTGRKSATEHLCRTDMLSYFQEDAIITGDMVECGKPYPDIFLLAAKRLGVEPAHCIGVEDSFNGIRAVAAAGMRPVMIPDMLTPTPEIRALAWRTCHSLLDLIPLLEENKKMQS